MAKKEKSFAAKVKKVKDVKICPVCEKPVTSLLLVKSVKSETTGAWKFKEKNIGVCKCNETEIWG